MRWIEQYQLFLFDFDGLLVDTEPLHFAAYVAVCRKYGFELTWNFAQFCQAAHLESQGIREALYAEFPDLLQKQPRWEVLYQEKKEVYEQMLQEGEVAFMPGAEALLDTLQHLEVKHAVVTNSFRRQVELIQAALPVLQKIPAWFTREDYERPKPASDGYQKAIALLAQPGERSIGFEDSMKGLRSLLGAQATGVLISPPDHPHVQVCSQLGAYHFDSLATIQRGCVLGSEV